MSKQIASRMNQLDAAQLDADIYLIFRDQVKKITEYLPPGKGDRFQSEIELILKFFIWFYSLRGGNSTFGQRFLNLKYSNLSKNKAFLFLALTALPKYIQEKMQHRNRIKNYIEPISDLVNIMSFVNLLFFLVEGKQPLLIERILRLSSETSSQNRMRNIGYSFMARELLWDGLLQLLTLGLPMVNLHYLRQSWNRFWFKRKKTIRSISPKMEENTTCAYCGDRPILPMHAGCEHLFCYYCIKGHFTAMNVFLCPRCGVDLHVKNVQVYTSNSIS